MTESPAPPDAEAAAYCAGRVRRLDRDRWLAALFAPEDRRAALNALYAFNIELAGIRESVSEPMLGRIRLQWWREALDGIHDGTPRRHAVALALADAVARFGLERGAFEEIIDAREFDMDDRAPDSLAELEGYAAGSAGALSRLALAALGADSADASEAARRGGIAWALSGLLRAVPFHAAQRRCYLPAELMAEAGLREARLFERKDEDALARVVSRVAECAREHLASARAQRAAIPGNARAALLPLALAGSDLRRLERAGFSPFAVRESGPLARQGRIALAALTGRY